MDSLARVSKAPPITLLKKDFDYLSHLSDVEAPSAVARFLEQELSRARVVQSTNRKVVRLGARVRYQDLSKTTPSTITLVAPQEADISHQRVSVMTPVGAALIGLEEGQRISFVMPWTGERTLQVLKVDP